jgi:hypothetical protein
VSGQLESQHFFRSGDTIRDPLGRVGKVVDGRALYALVEWEGGVAAELDQFDPRYIVVERAEQ